MSSPRASIKKKMDKIYESEASYAQGLFIALQNQAVRKGFLKPYHFVEEFVLIYDLYPLNIYSSMQISKELLMQYFKQFLYDKGFKENDFSTLEYQLAQSSFWKYGIEYQRIVTNTVITRTAFISTAHKLDKIRIINV